jgi:hypothetical protein
MSDSTTPQPPSSTEEVKPETLARNDLPIEGGDVEDLDKPRIKFDTSRHREETATKLATMIFVILGLTGLIHYVMVVVLVCNGHDQAVSAVKDFFNAWLPIIAGLSGSAATYYFTRDRK